MIYQIVLIFAFLIGMLPFFPRQEENKYVIRSQLGSQLGPGVQYAIRRGRRRRFNPTVLP
jgi:hypothetical protein